MSVRDAFTRDESAKLPADCAPYRRTPDFTQDTIPAGLLREHRTARGVWGLIHVVEGKLLYRVSGLGGLGGFEREICAGDPPGVIEPEQLHEVAPRGKVRFYVEFYRGNKTTPSRILSSRRP